MLIFRVKLDFNVNFQSIAKLEKMGTGNNFKKLYNIGLPTTCKYVPY